MLVFVGCSKDDAPSKEKIVTVVFGYGFNGQYVTQLGITYSPDINANLELAIRLTGNNFDSTLIAQVPANWTSVTNTTVVKINGKAEMFKGTYKEFPFKTSVPFTSAEMVSIKCSDPTYKIRILSRN